jgi:hypothetical protein
MITSRMTMQTFRRALIALTLVLALGGATYAQLPDDRTSGTITANSQAVSLTPLSPGRGSGIIQASGTFTLTMVPEVTVNGTTWTTLQVTNLASGSTVTAITAAGSYGYTAAGAVGIRVRSSAYTSGTANITLQVSSAGGGTGGGSGGGGGTTFNGVLLDADAGDPITDTANNALRVNIVAGAAAGGTSSTFGAAVPAVGTAIGLSDGTNEQNPRVFDVDSGGGTQYVAGVNLRKIASGGSVEAATSTDPLRVDPTGTTTQPVSAASLPLPSGASTSANQTTELTSLSSIDGKLVTTRTADYDSGAGTVTTPFTGIALPASGGPVAGGTSTNPLRTDPTNATATQVSGATTLADNMANPTTAIIVAAHQMCWDSGGGNWDRCTGAAADTELPAAAALADNTANPTVPAVGAFLMCWDTTGSNWDRCPSGAAGAGTTDSNTSRTVEATDSQLSTDVAAIKTAVQLIDDDQTGATKTNVTSAATTNSTSARGSAGRLMGIWLINTTTTVYYIRFYESSSAPTCSSATGFQVSLPIPPASAAGQAGGFSFQFGPTGLAFATGIGYCITGGSSSTDNTNAATGVFGFVATKP